MYRNPDLLNVREGRRVTTKTGEKLSVDDMKSAWSEWGSLISFLDNVERNVTYSHEEYLALPAQLVQIRALCGFSRATQEDERLHKIMKAMFGDEKNGKSTN